MSGSRQLLASSKATTLLWFVLSSSSTMWDSPYHPSGNGLELKLKWSSTTSKIIQNRPAMATVLLLARYKESRWSYSSPIMLMIRISSLSLGATQRRPSHLSSSIFVGSVSISNLLLDMLAKHKRQRLFLSPYCTKVTIIIARYPLIWLLKLTWNPNSWRSFISYSWNVSST